MVSQKFCCSYLHVQVLQEKKCSMIFSGVEYANDI